MNLVVDIGNTMVKCAIFDGHDMLKTYTARRLSEHALMRFLAAYPMPTNAIVANTRNHAAFAQYLKIIQEHTKNLTLLSADTPVPLRNHYKTPLTLGADRLAAAVGANSMFPHHNILIISMGTALVFDLVVDGEFLGGSISLGLRMRYMALHRCTANLPLCAPALPMRDFGQTTSDAVIAGVQNGMLHEIRGVIACFEKKQPPLHTILTGGDANFLADMLPNAVTITNLTLVGLNEILNYQ
jgi:type III pantothenate kinase